MAYTCIEPIGEYRHELRHGQMMALTCNLNRDPKKRREPYAARDFMNFIDLPDPPEPTPEELSAQLTEMFTAMAHSAEARASNE